jgi:hypothetical protein
LIFTSYSILQKLFRKKKNFKNCYETFALQRNPVGTGCEQRRHLLDLNGYGAGCALSEDEAEISCRGHQRILIWRLSLVLQLTL